MKILLALMLSVFSVNAFASSKAEQTFLKKLYSVIEAGSEVTQEIDFDSLSAPDQAALLKAAEYESNIWYDTILEGDYQLKDGASVEFGSLTKIYSAAGEFVAYKGQIQHEAYDTGSCDIPYEEDDATIQEYMKENCVAGYISSGIYISPDFKFHLRDENAIEDFEE
ncbi:hypothetical protein [Bdellovibrio bacteriovorus]|uniref:hypothetical protein n=1 Tax=Bdellovibrio bacteriovorus TaxID=959 RepID=UPI0035A64E13